MNDANSVVDAKAGGAARQLDSAGCSFFIVMSSPLPQSPGGSRLPRRNSFGYSAKTPMRYILSCFSFHEALTRVKTFTMYFPFQCKQRERNSIYNPQQYNVLSIYNNWYQGTLEFIGE